jgi:hypothetical protein
VQAIVFSLACELDEISRSIFETGSDLGKEKGERIARLRNPKQIPHP